MRNLFQSGMSKIKASNTVKALLCHMLATPVSNASVERVFSQMNLVKSKLRNRMQQISLENTLHVRAFMQRNGICCPKFTPTQEMLSLFTQDIHCVDTDNDNSDYVDSDA